jgi:hypothetical protein
LPVHDKEFVCRHDAAPLPDRQQPPATIPLARQTPMPDTLLLGITITRLK